MKTRTDSAVLFLLVLAFLTPAFAQNTHIFNQASVYPIGGIGESLAIADFNHDGKPDVVTANGSTDSISVLLDGSRGLAPHIDSASGDFPLAVATGDFNGDGQVDVVNTNYGTRNAGTTVSVLLGKGDGTFQAHVEYSVGQYPTSVAVADFDGDGKQDLVVGTQKEVDVLFGNGDGTFRTALTLSPGAASVAAGDLNGDGHADIVAADGAYVVIFLSNGNGTFRAGATYLAKGTGSLILADFNRDGKLDIAGVNLDGYLSVLFGNGGGTFQSEMIYPGGYTPFSVFAADLNGDGYLDLAVADDLEPAIGVLLNEGDGTFKPVISYGDIGSSLGVAAADFNGDGKLDLAASTGTFNGDSVNVVIGNGDGTYKARGEYTTGQYPVGIASGDFNSDGIPDVVTADANGRSLSVLLGYGNGSLQSRLSTPATSPRALTVGDFNADGNLDVASVTPGYYSIFLGKGNGTFQPEQRHTNSAKPAAITTVDLNNDGNLDLALAVNGQVELLAGQGNGAFGSQTHFNTGGGFNYNFASADLNHDGNADLVVATGLGVSVLLGNGDGTLRSYKLYGDSAVNAVTIADLNADGILDIAGQIQSSGLPLVLIGNGDGTFQQEPQHSFALWSGLLNATPPDILQSAAIIAADFNHDGVLDLAAGSAYVGYVNLFIGDGQGNFAIPVPYTVGGFSGMTSADFNGDGLPDLAVTEPRDYDSTVGVLINTGRSK